MQRRIEYSPRALKDLDGIWDYIEKDLNVADTKATRLIRGESVSSLMLYLQEMFDEWRVMR